MACSHTVLLAHALRALESVASCFMILTCSHTFPFALRVCDLLLHELDLLTYLSICLESLWPPASWAWLFHLPFSFSKIEYPLLSLPYKWSEDWWPCSLFLDPSEPLCLWHHTSDRVIWVLIQNSNYNLSYCFWIFQNTAWKAPWWGSPRACWWKLNSKIAHLFCITVDFFRVFFLNWVKFH